MTKKKIDIHDYAGEIIKAMRLGILLTTKVGGKVNSMTIGWGRSASSGDCNSSTGGYRATHLKT